MFLSLFKVDVIYIILGSVYIIYDVLLVRH